MKRKLIPFLGLFILLCVMGCDGMNKDVIYYHDYDDPFQNELVFSTSFDENEGNEVIDQTTSKKAIINYVFTDAKYKASIDPTWISKSAISGSCLSFDGYSNFIKYEYQDVQISGPHLTIDLFVSPRMFEWDIPGAVAINAEHLQVILGQYNIAENQGFVVECISTVNTPSKLGWEIAG